MPCHERSQPKTKVVTIEYAYLRNKSASQKHNRRHGFLPMPNQYWPLPRVWCQHMLRISIAHSELIRMLFLPHDTVLLLPPESESEKDWCKRWCSREKKRTEQNVTLLRLVPKSFSMEMFVWIVYVDTVAMINADWYLHFTMYLRLLRY